jgi:integrase
MPNRIAFTQLAVERLQPPAAGRVTYWDKLLPGFGLRIAPPRAGSRTPRKTWIAMGRVDGKPVMDTIGTLLQVPKVDEARRLARERILQMKGGAKPLDEREAQKKRRAAEAAATDAAAREAVEGQFAAVAERFLAEHVERNCSPKYGAEVRRILERDVLPRWGERAVREITKHDVNELLDAKASRRDRPRKGAEGGAAIQANRTLMRLRKLFAWAAAQNLIAGDPSAGVLPRAKERARDRVLDDDEIARFWLAAERAGWPFGPIFKLMLLTAQRESEVAGLRWSETDLEKRLWTIPRERTKSDRAHLVHLSELAAGVLGALPRVGEFVFPTRTDRPIASFGKAKERVDALMIAQLRDATGDPEAELPGWVLHDLRRTATTIMAERLKVPPHIADKILNHSAGAIRGVAAIYNKAAYLDERKAALEALGRFVEGLVSPGGANNVVALRA